MYERILECAKLEFLAHGFVDASLRTIAKNAGTSTGSIYTRFGDKAGLFREIVEPVSSEYKRMFLEIQEAFHQMDEAAQRENVGVYTADEQARLFDYIYDHFEEFRLLLDASYGTRFQNFVDELVRIEVAYTYRFMEIVYRENPKPGNSTAALLHIVTTAYFNGMFEAVRHNMEREQARRYISMLATYHRAGFDAIFAHLN